MKMKKYKKSIATAMLSIFVLLQAAVLLSLLIFPDFRAPLLALEVAILNVMASTGFSWVFRYIFGIEDGDIN